jgi:predicted transcriptional regulator
MQNRQKDEILRDILAVCNGGSSITKVMFYAYISHAQAKAHMEHLIENGLVEHDHIDKKFLTTSKGMEYLAVIERMTELFPVSTKRAAKARVVSQFA